MNLPRPIVWLAMAVLVFWGLWDELLYRLIPLPERVEDLLADAALWVALPIMLMDRETRGWIFYRAREYKAYRDLTPEERSMRREQRRAQQVAQHQKKEARKRSRKRPDRKAS